jgi:hypothetical protein
LTSYPWKRTTKSSNSNSKISEEIQTAPHRSPLFQSTQIPDRSPPLHIQCSEWISQTAPLGLESFAVPQQVVHCFVVLQTYTYRSLNNSKSTQVGSGGTMTINHMLNLLKRTMTYPGFEPGTFGLAVSIANHYTI